MRSRSCCLAMCVAAAFLGPTIGKGWSPYTHNYLATEAYNDVIDDGLVTVNGRVYQVPPAVVLALVQCPTYFNAGAAFDLLPDIAYSQMILHPGPQGSKAAAAAYSHTGTWAGYLLEQAWKAQSDNSGYSPDEKMQILAFTYGCMMHIAGDVWGHTVINEFAGGVFPSIAESFTDMAVGNTAKAEIIIRHKIAEGYIQSATPGTDDWKGDPSDRQTVVLRDPPGGADISDDETAGFPYDIPVKFVYRALVDPAAPTPLRPPPYSTTNDEFDARGLLIGFYLRMDSTLADLVSTPPNPLEEAVNAYNDVIADVMNVEENCGFPPSSDCIEALLNLGLDPFESFFDAVTGMHEALVQTVVDSYIYAWRGNIQKGLEQWPQFGLLSTRAFCDPQARRDYQNYLCSTKGSDDTDNRARCEADVKILDVAMYELDLPPDPAYPGRTAFISDYLLGMSAGPVGDVMGWANELTTAVSDFLDDILVELGLADNPVYQAVNGTIDDVKDDLKDRLKDEIDGLLPYPLLGESEDVADLLERPSRHMSDEQALVGPLSLSLFGPDDHARLDDYLGLRGEHHLATGPETMVGLLTPEADFAGKCFAAASNTVTMEKLAFLGSEELDRLLSDTLGRRITLYTSEDGTFFQNVLVTSLRSDPAQASRPWLRMIDGDHAWRRDGMPIFHDSSTPDENDASERDPCWHGGTGDFPLWASCVLRPAFRKLFVDWERGGGFPDYGDSVHADPTDDPHSPTSTCTQVAGVTFSAGGRRFIGADNRFAVSATDSPLDKAFGLDELEVQYRFYAAAAVPGDYQAVQQNGEFTVLGGDGRYIIETRAADPCHGFDGTPSPADAPFTSEVCLDTASPTITCGQPPFGLIFESDAVTTLAYDVDDGGGGSGVAEYSSMIDGYLTSNGVAAITNGTPLDMFYYYPGIRSVTIAARDNLGNSGTSLCTFEIRVTARSLIPNLLRARTSGLVPSLDVYTGLMDKLLAAQSAHDRAQHRTECNILAAFVNQLLAQRGRGIDAVTADRFIAYARSLIARAG